MGSQDGEKVRKAPQVQVVAATTEAQQTNRKGPTGERIAVMVEMLIR
jgi:hypothetical protein